MKIVLVSSEVAPFSKTGGLADVCGALPRALAAQGAEVTVITPYHRSAQKQPTEKSAASVRVPLNGQVLEAGVREGKLGEVPVRLIEHEAFFDREGLYGTPQGDYPDNAARFIFFARAAMELMKQSGPPDILHAHDWQAGLLPIYARTIYSAAFEKAKTVFTIHNLAYQGMFWHYDMPMTGLDWKHFNWKELEFYGKINFLKAALVHADALTTVSPTYAREIRTPEFGCGLDGVLRDRAARLYGIVNGVDYGEWNPETDPHLPANFSARTFAGKAKCKAELQKRLKLPKKDAPLFGFIGRLVEQKGVDLLSHALEELLSENVQIAMLGSGDPKFEKPLLAMAAANPDRLSVTIAFDTALAHLIEAGSDLFLMPSKFEPCGLNQMYSLRYGTPPIVRATGGLADTIVDASLETLKKGAATGFVFEEYTPDALLEAVHRALALFKDKKDWKKLAVSGMKQDFSWDRSAKEYLSLFASLAP